MKTPHLPPNSTCPNVMGGLNCIYPDCSCYAKPESELTKLKAVAGEMERALEDARERIGKTCGDYNGILGRIESALLSYRALKG